MIESLIFILVAWSSYEISCRLIKRFGPSRSLPTLSGSGPPKLSIEEFIGDPAACVLLGLTDGADSRCLLTSGETEPAFAVELAVRRRELIQAYSSGQLNNDVRDTFRRHLLQLPGVAVEVEVQRVLNAATSDDYDKLRVRTPDRIGRVEALWRWLTLPSVPKNIQNADGPCLMFKAITADVEYPPDLQGRVTSVAGDRIKLDFGLCHGLGPGDVVQFGRQSDGEWIGTGVIESVGDASSSVLWMGEGPPKIGDRAIASLDVL